MEGELWSDIGGQNVGQIQRLTADILTAYFRMNFLNFNLKKNHKLNNWPHLTYKAAQWKLRKGYRHYRSTQLFDLNLSETFIQNIIE